jgi:hypothetical protein
MALLAGATAFSMLQCPNVFWFLFGVAIYDSTFKNKLAATKFIIDDKSARHSDAKLLQPTLHITS